MEYKKISLLFITSILVYSLVFDLSYINIFNIDWLYSNSEYQSYQIAFEFYKNDLWRWPITSNPNYGTDINNNILLSDNVPFLNILFKVFSHFISSNFQFYGSWILLCLFLQCFFSYKIIFHYTKNFKYSYISSTFFILLPILLDRIYFHLSLIAHWLVLWAFYLSIKDLNKKKFNYKWILILTISSLTNFYFFIIVISIFSYSWIFNLNYQLIDKIKILCLNYFYCLLILYLFGFFDINVINYATYGFGFYKSNLLTLLDSTGGISSRNWSNFNLFDFKNIKGEHAGFGYLGFGGIILFLILILNLVLNRRKHFYKIFIFAILFFLISITNRIHIGNYNLVTIDLNIYLYGFLSFFRASGRFICVVYYIICISSFVLIYKNSKKINPIYIGTFILVIQLFDISNIFFEKKQILKRNYYQLQSFFWEKEIYGKYKSLLYSYPIGSQYTLSKHVNLLSDSKFINTNITYQGRADQKKLALSRYNLYKKLSNKSLDDSELIIIDPNHLIYINYIYKNEDYGIINSDDIWILLKNKKNLMSQDDFQRLQNFLPKNLEKNIIIDQNNINSYLGFGWYKSKSLWSDGYESTIIFNQSENFQKILISCDLFNYNNNSNNLKFEINNKKIKDVKITKNNSEYLIELNVEKLTNSGPNILKVLNSNDITRMDLLIAPDGRILGLKFKNLKIL